MLCNQIRISTPSGFGGHDEEPFRFPDTGFGHISDVSKEDLRVYFGVGFRARLRSCWFENASGMDDRDATSAFSSLLLAVRKYSLESSWALVTVTSFETVASGRLTVSVGNQTGQLALYSEGDLSSPHPGIVRVIVVFHGLHRNAAGYLHDLEEAREKAGTPGDKSFLIAPQFLDEDDARSHKLSGNVLRWRRNQWEAGELASGPAPISSYDAIDAILVLLSNRANFPDLREIVLAGHSGGGQIVQRYAVVGHQIAAVGNTGIALSFVVANPSSYVYFDEFRPVPAVAQRCRGFNEWKYGLRDAPRYVTSDAAELEATYVTRRVTYLLGTNDDDPNGPDIDKNCAAEAQGPTRLSRGADYFKYLQSRHHAALEHRVLLVPGVAHDAKKMFTSVCGIDALFQTGACRAARVQ